MSKTPTGLVICGIINPLGGLIFAISERIWVKTMENDNYQVEGKRFCNVHKNNHGRVLFKGLKGGLIATNEKNLLDIEDMR